MLPVPELSIRPSVAPSLVMTNQLLGCNLLELPQRLLVQAADNPTLRVLPARACPRCGFMHQDKCPLCARQLFDPKARALSLEALENWEERLPAPGDFRDELLAQARLALDKSDHPLAELIIAALDEHGLLSGDVLRQTVLPQRAERVLRAIQSLDPPGIAARDMAECFRLQLQRLEVPIPPVVHRLIERWPNLPESRQALARAAQASPEELDIALAFMRTHLRPFPILDASGALPLRRVDVAILPSRDPAAPFEIIIAPGPDVRVSDDPANLGDAAMAGGWRALAQQGQVLAHILRWRAQMLQQVFAEIARCQQAFLLQGLEHHQPLTRAQVARAVGVHASTVGRAVATKSVLIPSGQVIPAALFFERGAAIKLAIREITAQTRTPLTDEQLGERLAERGIRLARRTVAKYRAAAGVLPARWQWKRGDAG